MPDSSVTILVLRKTRLSETDLIITGFSEAGQQVRAVAKGARRPGSRLGAHLELYSVTRLLLHEGRNLGTITEASRVDSNEACRGDVLHSAGAAVIVELLDKVSMDGDREPRLFPLACEALRCVGAVPDEGIALIAAATVLKVAAQLGFRPSLRACVLCGGDPDGGALDVGLSDVSEADALDTGAFAASVPDTHASAVPETAVTTPAASAASAPPAPVPIAFSFDQGGIVCADCLREALPGSYQDTDAQIINWAEVLITSRFIDLEAYADAKHEALGRALLEFSREWLRAHLVNRLKSLDFLLTFSTTSAHLVCTTTAAILSQNRKHRDRRS
jgi:DNA repair protein RecO (recombination protein O)